MHFISDFILWTYKFAVAFEYIALVGCLRSLKPRQFHNRLYVMLTAFDLPISCTRKYWLERLYGIFHGMKCIHQHKYGYNHIVSYDIVKLHFGSGQLAKLICCEIWSLNHISKFFKFLSAVSIRINGTWIMECDYECHIFLKQIYSWRDLHAWRFVCMQTNDNQILEYHHWW